MKKLALVLSGGGFKGAFQLGALQYLRDNWQRFYPENPVMKFDIVAGVSVGALNGLLVASGKMDELEKLWNDVGTNGVGEIYSSDFIDTAPTNGQSEPKLKVNIDWPVIKKNFPNATKNLMWRGVFNRSKIFEGFRNDFQNFQSLASNEPLWKKLQLLAKKADIKDTIYKCGFVSLDTGAYASIRSDEFLTDEDFANGVIASSVMPIVWKPVSQIKTTSTNYQQLVDGGIRNVSPLGDVIREINAKQDASDEYDIIIINCSSGLIIDEKYANKNVLQIALRSLNDIAITEIFNHDIKEFIDKNFILKQVREKHPGTTIYDYDYSNNKPGLPMKFFNSVIIQPDEGTLGDTLLANDILIENRKNHGKLKAEAAFEKFFADGEGDKFAIA